MQLPEDATMRAPLALVVGMAGWDTAQYSCPFFCCCFPFLYGSHPVLSSQPLGLM